MTPPRLEVCGGWASTLEPLTCTSCGARFGAGCGFVRRASTVQRADGSIAGSWCGPCAREGRPGGDVGDVA